MAGQISRFGTRSSASSPPTTAPPVAPSPPSRPRGRTLPPVTGNDATTAGLQRIISGDQYNTISKPSEIVAAAAADVAVQLLPGQTPTAQATVFDTPSQLFTPVVVTKDNIKAEIIDKGIVKVTDICTAPTPRPAPRSGSPPHERRSTPPPSPRTGRPRACAAGPGPARHPSASAPSTPSTTSTSTSAPARSSRSSATTAPASRRWSRPSPGCTARRRHDRVRRDGRSRSTPRARPRARHRDGVPGPRALREPRCRRQPLPRPRARPVCTLDEVAMERARGGCSGSCRRDPDVRIPVASLSGGQRQTVAIARSLLGEPKVVILDEPTAALGVAQTAEVLDLVERLRERGLGVILISHNMADVRAVADRVVVLRLGRNNGVFHVAGRQQEEIIAAITGANDNVVTRRAARRGAQRPTSSRRNATTPTPRRARRHPAGRAATAGRARSTPPRLGGRSAAFWHRAALRRPRLAPRRRRAGRHLDGLPDRSTGSSSPRDNLVNLTLRVAARRHDRPGHRAACCCSARSTCRSARSAGCRRRSSPCSS